MSTNTTIHVGFWTNWTKGSISGSTLTLTNRNGAIMIAALAIFINRGQVMANHILYRPPDQSYQGTKRCDVPPAAGWAWQTRLLPHQSSRRSIGLILTAVLHLSAFIAAGILSSHLSTTGNQVLVSPSPYCGTWRTAGWVTGLMETESDYVYSSYHRFTIDASNQYVKNCLSTSQSLPECNAYKQTRLNWTSTMTACPFGDLCLGPHDSSLSMDTGLLDSRQDFGINGQDIDRVQWRRNATCVPITTDGYVFRGNSSMRTASVPSNTFNFDYFAAFYGPSQLNSSLFGFPDPALQNATYTFTNFRQIAGPFYNGATSSYNVIVETADAGLGFDPIAPLRVTNSTLNLIFASFDGLYSGSSDDLWLSAHIPAVEKEVVNGTVQPIKNLPLYSLDHTVSVLACTNQVQFCNPSRNSGSQPTCSPQSSLYDVSNSRPAFFKQIFDTENQVQTAMAIALALDFGGLTRVIEDSSSVPLLAAELSSAQWSLPLPANQWILEAGNWFTVGLAAIQHNLVEYATGPPSEYTQFVPKHQAANDASLAWLCGSQTIRRNDFINFSTLATALIIGLGTMIIGTSLWLETCVGWLRSKRKLKQGEWRQNSWWADETLQLQMQARNGMGVYNGKWEIGKLMVPVTNKDNVWSSVRSDEKKLSFLRGEFITDFKDSALGCITPVSQSSTMMSKDLRRARSNSV